MENINNEEIKDKLFNSISQLKEWLYKSYGMGMMLIIDSVLDKYKDRLSNSEINKFKSGIEILRKTSMPNIDKKLIEKLPRGIENAKLIKRDGEFSFLNKLNTNYLDLSELITELILRGINTNKEKGMFIYNKVMNDPKEGLLFLVPSMEKLLNKYFTTIEDLEKFATHAKKMSQIGEHAEDQVADHLSNFGFNILYQGGDGDFIDMIFGCDLIVYREDFGYKTIQVKNKLPEWKYIEYYKVDWVATGGMVDVYDLSKKSMIDLERR